MPRIEALHERKFAGKPLKSLKLYYDPFGQNEMCVELSFTDGEIASVCIGPGRPQIISAVMCYEPESSAAQNQEEEDRDCSRSDLESSDRGRHLAALQTQLARYVHP